jgi:hypothetical protein
MWVDFTRQAGSRVLGAEYQDDLRSYRGWQAPGQENGQAVSYYAGSGAGVFREFAVRQEAVSRQKNSVSSNPGRYTRTDAAMDKPWQKYTSRPRRQQRPWTVRPSETPGLPSWAAGSGSGSVPLPFVTSCILKPLTSVFGCLSVVDCNQNASGLQSAHFQDHIICIYPPSQDRIIGRRRLHPLHPGIRRG